LIGTRKRNHSTGSKNARSDLRHRHWIGRLDRRWFGADEVRRLSATALLDRRQRAVSEFPFPEVVVMFLFADGQLVGLIAVADAIRSSTPEAIRLLHEEGLRIIMLTGDSQATADAVARRIGIDEVIAEVLPAQKHEVVRRLQSEGHIVAMAGDGINDAPALAQAQVGIAMGTGTDVAMESAGVTLVQGDLRAVARARRLSRATTRHLLTTAFVFMRNSPLNRHRTIDLRNPAHCESSYWQKSHQSPILRLASRTINVPPMPLQTMRLPS
jgi:soluble P-type ATPase